MVSALGRVLAGDGVRSGRDALPATSNPSVRKKANQSHAQRDSRASFTGKRTATSTPGNDYLGGNAGIEKAFVFPDLLPVKVF
jgi:hypothetical protein